MSSIPILADAFSRLHADIAIVRLTRAGIAKERISAIFPRHQTPNSVCCWFPNFQVIPDTAGLEVAAAGVLGRVFRRGMQAARVSDVLEGLGFRSDFVERIVDKIQGGQFVLCVHARNENEAAIAWHILQHVGAENITCTDPEALQSAAGHPVVAPQSVELAA